MHLLVFLAEQKSCTGYISVLWMEITEEKSNLCSLLASRPRLGKSCHLSRTCPDKFMGVLFGNPVWSRVGHLCVNFTVLHRYKLFLSSHLFSLIVHLLNFAFIDVINVLLQIPPILLRVH